MYNNWYIIMNNQNDASPNQYNDNNSDSYLTVDKPKDTEVFPNYFINTVSKIIHCVKNYGERHSLLGAEEEENEQGDHCYCDSDNNAIEAKNMEEAVEDALKVRIFSSLDDDSK